VLSVSALGAEGFSRPAIELRNPKVAAPIETAGTGLAPEAGVRVRVDERGHVAEVTVTGLTPSTEYDELFVQAIEETLADWRYAPKLENGVPVSVELSWTLQFYPKSERHRGSWQSTFENRSGGSAETRRSQFLSLERSQREGVLKRISGEMVSHLDGEVHRYETPRFVVLTDSDPKRAEAIANNLEALYGVLLGMLGGELSLQEEPLKIVTVVYSRQRTYQAMISGAEMFEWTSGYYHPSGAIAFHLEAPTSDFLLGLMLHEATHAFLDRHVVARGVALPRWLSEGFAEYMGNSKVKKGELIPGKTQKRKTYMSLAGAGIATTDAWMDVTQAKRAANTKRWLTLREIFGAGDEVFFGDKRDLYYPTAWFLVHYLRHSNTLGSEERFSELMTYAAEGYPAEPAFELVYGRSVESVEEDFRQYVLKF